MLDRLDYCRVRVKDQSQLAHVLDINVIGSIEEEIGDTYSPSWTLTLEGERNETKSKDLFKGFSTLTE